MIKLSQYLRDASTVALVGAIALPSLAMAQTAQPSPGTGASAPSQNGLTVPSLWWTVEQFGGILENWLAYPARGNTPGQIELVVRQEAWRPLGYIQRYAFINHFGTVARDYGYNLQVFDQEKDLLASYTCDFSKASPQYVAGVRDSQGRPVPDYVPGSGVTCRVQLSPLII